METHRKPAARGQFPSFPKTVIGAFAFGIAGITLLGLRVPQLQSPIFRNLLSGVVWAGYTHVIAGATALLVGGIGLSCRIRHRWIRVHEWSGRVYVACVLISSLGALVSNYVSESALVTRAAFLVLNIIWLIVTLLGFPFADQFDRKTHGKLMTISYALTLSAVSLRLYLFVMIIANIPFEIAYPIAAWAAWLGNLAIVLWIFRRRERNIEAQLSEITGTHVAASRMEAETKLP